ncbi:hypothetical protein EJB05_31636 [Eragrostis curvula]|uniref:Replication protein A 70 kDa DNA-binding subunit B/D first OB fold domain-containing protein n=1 Tax=Eragrostis curvula TaxID=38414 RepID=A0A5J9UEW4_9POAL|nr:hypothetical protein EJB05_31636 [Eragrostis curvula]
MASKLSFLRAGISSQAKMDSSEEDGFTPLSRLTPGYHRCCKVGVRVSRMWVASHPLMGTKFGLDCLLIDDEGVTMQARADPSDMKHLQQQIVEGKIYDLSNFRVCSSRNGYMACRNGLMMQIGKQTVVEEIEDDTGSSIPIHCFDFVDFKDVKCRNGDKRFFTDVIGQIISIEDAGEAWKWEAWSNIPFRNINLRDSRDNKLKVALFGDLGRNFDADQVRFRGQHAPVVAVFAGMLVQYYAGIGLTVRSSSASKYYLNLEIPEVHQFRASLRDPHILIGQLSCQKQNPVNPTEFVNKWRTIKQLKSFPDELQNPPFFCRAIFKGIDCSNGWSYWSCSGCRVSINYCVCLKNGPPVRRYKLDALIEDDTGTMNVMIFDEPAQELVGVPVEDLDDEIMRDKWSLCRDFAIAFENGNFVVKRVLSDDMSQLSGSTQVAAAGGSGISSQEEGSSASSTYTSSPKVKKENMVMIKEGREPKRLKTADEADQTDDTKEGRKKEIEDGQ